MDIQKTVTEILSKLNANDALKADFLKNPVETLKNTLGINVSDEQINQIIEAVKAKLTEAGASGILDKIKGIFGK